MEPIPKPVTRPLLPTIPESGVTEVREIIPRVTEVRESKPPEVGTAESKPSQKENNAREMTTEEPKNRVLFVDGDCLMDRTRVYRTTLDEDSSEDEDYPRYKPYSMMTDGEWEEEKNRKNAEDDPYQ